MGGASPFNGRLTASMGPQTAYLQFCASVAGFVVETFAERVFDTVRRKGSLAETLLLPPPGVFTAHPLPLDEPLRAAQVSIGPGHPGKSL